MMVNAAHPHSKCKMTQKALAAGCRAFLVTLGVEELGTAGKLEVKAKRKIQGAINIHDNMSQRTTTCLSMAKK